VGAASWALAVSLSTWKPSEASQGDCSSKAGERWGIDLLRSLLRERKDVYTHALLVFQTISTAAGPCAALL